MRFIVILEELLYIHVMAVIRHNLLFFPYMYDKFQVSIVVEVNLRTLSQEEPASDVLDRELPMNTMVTIAKLSSQAPASPSSC